MVRHPSAELFGKLIGQWRVLNAGPECETGPLEDWLAKQWQKLSEDERSLYDLCLNEQRELERHKGVLEGLNQRRWELQDRCSHFITRYEVGGQPGDSRTVCCTCGKEL